LMMYSSGKDLKTTSALWSKREDLAKPYVDSQRGTQRQKTDFQISMEQGAEDFKISMTEAGKSFEIAANRAEKSISRLGHEANGTIEELQKRANDLASSLGIDNIEMLTQISKLIKANPDIKDQEGTPGTATNYKPGDKRKDPSGLFTATYAATGGGQNYQVNAFTRRYDFNQNDGKKAPKEKLPEGWMTWTKKEAMDWYYGQPDAGTAPDGNKALANKYGRKRNPNSDLNTWSMQTLAAVGVPGSINTVTGTRSLSSDVVKGMGQNRYATQAHYNPVTQTYNNVVQYGPVTVQSGDPDDMGRKLDTRHRQQNRRRGANAK
jgi:hypothetical protein